MKKLHNIMELQLCWLLSNKIRESNEGTRI